LIFKRLLVIWWFLQKKIVEIANPYPSGVKDEKGLPENDQVKPPEGWDTFWGFFSKKGYSSNFLSTTPLISFAEI